MSAVSRRDVANVLLDHVMVVDSDLSRWVCMTVDCQWWAPRGIPGVTLPVEAARVDLMARVAHAEHLPEVLAEAGLLDLADPAEADAWDEAERAVEGARDAAVAS